MYGNSYNLQLIKVPYILIEKTTDLYKEESCQSILRLILNHLSFTLYKNCSEMILRVFGFDTISFL